MRKKSSAESGFTLVETLIAILIFTAGLLSLAQVLTFTVMASKTHGQDAAKITAAAHDKMEELTNLDFTDTTTNLTVDPPYTTDGVGLTEGGSIPPTTPAAGYVDYLDASGARTTADNAVFTRQWQIIDDTTFTDLKRILVNVTANRSFEVGENPSTTLVMEIVP
jgi:Tfp pilus assembly protein PilV